MLHSKSLNLQKEAFCAVRDSLWLVSIVIHPERVTATYNSVLEHIL